MNVPEKLVFVDVHVYEHEHVHVARFTIGLVGAGASLSLR